MACHFFIRLFPSGNEKLPIDRNLLLKYIFSIPGVDDHFSQVSMYSSKKGDCLLSMKEGFYLQYSFCSK